MLKTGSEWSFAENTAMYYILSLDSFVAPLGLFVLRSNAATTFLSILFRLLETLIPLLLFVPLCQARARTLAVVLAFVFHTLFGVLIELGMWMFVPPLALLALLPSQVWSALKQWRASRTTRRKGDLCVHFDARRALVCDAAYVACELLCIADRVSIEACDDANRDQVFYVSLKSRDRIGDDLVCLLYTSPSPRDRG